MSTVTVPMDDKEMFSSAMSDEPKQETLLEPIVEAAPEETQAERDRDEKGRFLPKTEVEQPVKVEQPIVEAKPETQDDQAGQVPSWRLREVREAREAAERRATE